ncbi:zinc finger CCHC domain-containing protein 4-like, partial [Tropilaelaps mercedesae]
MPLVEYVSVVPSDPDKSPACSHGPALLFDRVGKRFFACSACRDRKLCPLYVEVGVKRKFKTWLDVRERYVPSEAHSDPPQLSNDAHFCSKCCRIYPDIQNACSNHHLQNISPSETKFPSEFLAQLSDNKSHAQYHFHKDTLEFIVHLSSKFNKVLCLGTPSVFERLHSLGVNCHLADIDRRLEAFYSSTEFTWFNMLNRHAFRDGDNSALWKFVKSENCNFTPSSPRVTQTQNSDGREDGRFRSNFVEEKGIPQESMQTVHRVDDNHLFVDKIRRKRVDHLEWKRNELQRRNKTIDLTVMTSQTDAAGSIVNFACPNTSTGIRLEARDKRIVNENSRNKDGDHRVLSEERKYWQDVWKREDFLGQALVVVDPPFGGLLSALAKTLNELTKRGNWRVILMFPYFNEAQVKLHLPSLKMCDLAIRYRNHQKMKNNSSPVRLFTDIPLSEIPLPEPFYRYCANCVRWVHSVNIHCEDCGTCPSKNHAPTR